MCHFYFHNISIVEQKEYNTVLYYKSHFTPAEVANLTSSIVHSTYTSEIHNNTTNTTVNTRQLYYEYTYRSDAHVDEHLQCYLATSSDLCDYTSTVTSNHGSPYHKMGIEQKTGTYKQVA